MYAIRSYYGTEAEYKDLMERSGCRFVQVHDTGSPMNLVEGERV